MRAPNFCVFLLLSTGAISVIAVWPAKEAADKPLLTAECVSAKRADTAFPALVVSPQSLYLLWLESKGQENYLAIARVNNKTNGVVTVGHAMQPGVGGFKWNVGLFAAAPEDRPPVQGKSSRAFLLAYLGNGIHYVSGIGPYYLVGRLRLDQEAKTLHVEQLGQFFDHFIGLKGISEGGIIGPGEICLLQRRHSKGQALFLVGSDYTQIYSTTSADGGKTWSAPHVIAKNAGDRAHVVESAAGELHLFYSAFDGKGGRAAVQLQRSKDGQNWSKPAEVVGRTVEFSCPFIDAQGVIWLAFTEDKDQKGKTALLLTRSTDDGKTWEMPIPLTDAQHEDSKPAIAVYGKDLFLAFERAVPKGGFAKADDVRHQIWYGWKAVSDITFPDRAGPAPAADNAPIPRPRSKTANQGP